MILTADLHLGLESDSVIIDGLPSKVSDTIFRFRHLIYMAKRGGHSIIVEGDIFEISDPPQYILYEFYKLLKYAEEMGVEIFFLLGNHDCNSKYHSLLSSLAREFEFIHFISRPCNLIIQGIDTLFIPHVPRSTVTSYDDYLKEIKNNFTSKYDLVVTHAMVAKSVSYSTTIENNNHLTFERKNFPSAKIYSMGHVHRGQIIVEDHYNILIPGSLIMNDFGEITDEKGYFEINKSLKYKFVEFPLDGVHDYKQIKIDLRDKEFKSLNEKQIRVVSEKLLKVIVLTRDYSSINENEIRDELNKYGTVVRFETKTERVEEVETQEDEEESVIQVGLSYARVLKTWLEKQDISDTMKARALKMGKEIFEND